MARQRNNIARMPFEQREIVCRMLFDGHTNDEIRAAIAAADPDAPTAHDSSILAYSQGTEYQRYVESRRQWNEQLDKRRWAASLLNGGRGPQSLADMAEYAILEQLHQLAEGGLLETGKDVATVARAISTMQRTQLARLEAERDDTIRRLREEHQCEISELKQDNEALQTELNSWAAEVDRLTELCQRTGIDTTGTRRGELSDAARERIRRIYGLRD